jgi:hypothetical protein
MSEKPGWKGLGNLVGGWGKSGAKPLPTSSRRCEAGHPMAMDWVKCPYCEAARNAGEKTRINDAELTATEPVYNSSASGVRGPGTTRINDADDDLPNEPPSRPRESAPSSGGRRETMVDPGAGGDAPRRRSAATDTDDDRRRTRVMDPEDSDEPQPRGRSGGSRRLTGIVVTYTWSQLGELYEVREGRNFGGSGAIAMEGDREADILIGDERMSSAHFLILCQGGKYRVSDCNSTNGTFVNGVLVDALGIELVDNALIKAGDTLLTFKKLMPPGAVAQPAGPTPAEPPAAPDDSRSSTDPI